MARNQACKLQIFSAKHSDILQVVDAMFDKFATRLQVQRMIERNYHESVSLTAIGNYKRNHWQRFKDMVREQKATMVGVSELVGEDGLTAGVNALLWQELQKMTPAQLMSFKKLLYDGEKVALMKKQFALYAQEHRQRMKERIAATNEETETVSPAEDYAKAQRVVQQVKEIFGIGMTGAQAPKPPLLRGGKQEPPPDVPTVGRETTGA